MDVSFEGMGMSDEEIKKYIESTPYYGTCTYEFKEGIEDGIKWMKKQILNQNNKN